MRPLGTFFLAFAVIFLSYTFLVSLKTSLGFAPELILGALIAFTPFFSFLELLLLSAFALAFLAWAPPVSLEIIAIAGIPLVVFFIRKHLPSWPRVSNIFFLVLGVITFFLLTGWEVVRITPLVAFLDVLGTILWGMIVFEFFTSSHHAQRSLF